MQAALRLARHSASVRSANSIRCLATTANPAHVATQWEKMNAEDKSTVHEQLEEIMKKDWKQLSLDEKKAAYYVAFGPHGPRAPVSKPGDGWKIFAGTAALVGVTGIIYYAIRIFSPAPPRTINKEWQEASNERALEQKMNPITGIASEGYSGKGFVQK
ncbi:cytochrome c oxidase subunit v [Lentinula edodes]|uniref:Cytochrome c oxidase subunit v n=1 Tax=Lentinula edodes TaxID=5353 RepID=A0A1Q3DYJ4_LENED|nr:cytochrome c oxidase subunit v [Lentinula edodes]